MVDKKISIAMTTFNGERFIEEQLNSILIQSVKADEIIIFDDCSTDNTVKILNEIQSQNPNANIVVKKNIYNVGYIKNFYNAISCTSGDYIFLADQDDIWHYDKIERMIIKMEDTGAKAICSNFNLINKNGEQLLNCNYRINSFIKECNKELKEITFERLIWENISQGCTYCFTKDVKDVYLSLKNSILIHDYQIMLIASLIGKVFFYNEKLIDYRLHDNNTIGFDNKNKKRSFKLKKPLSKPIMVSFLCDLNNSIIVPKIGFYIILFYLRIPYVYMKIRG